MALVVESPGALSARSRDGGLDIALINNMPDAALLQTEKQFASLLEAAASELTVRLRRYTLPGVPRGESAAARIREHYFPIDALPESAPTAVIVTGSNPLEPELTDEPYWAELVELIDWARQHTASTIVSCLSAHALLFSADAVPRHRLPDKCHGVFEQRVHSGQPLTQGMPGRIRMPHSRQNDVPDATLVANGYLPIITSDEVGWTVAQKVHGDCLLVLMQGHPEYEPNTLLLEYRRDVRRYVLGERDWFPPLPDGYLPAEVEKMMAEFRDDALAMSPMPELMDRFPFDEAIKHVVCPWRAPAELLYVNWLSELARRAQTAEVADAG
jgi:homoserine O-succinyltransferase